MSEFFFYLTQEKRNRPVCKGDGIRIVNGAEREYLTCRSVCREPFEIKLHFIAAQYLALFKCVRGCICSDNQKQERSLYL